MSVQNCKEKMYNLAERCKKLASRIPEWPRGYRPGRRPSNNNTRPRHQERTNNDRRPN